MIILSLFAAGCGDSKDTIEIDSGRTCPASDPQVQGDARHTLTFAIGGITTPKTGFEYYRQILDYIGGRTGLKIKILDKHNYAEINRLLRSGNVDAAFVCGGPYVDGHEEFNLELLVAPWAYGGTVYYSYILVHVDSDVRNLEALRGNTFAFTDPLSNTGALVPTYHLARDFGETPRSFFNDVVFSRAHDKSIKMVARKAIDGAAVDSLIWEYLAKVDPRYTSRTRILEKYGPYGTPPVAVRPGLDPEIKNKLKHSFLDIHKDEKGMEILARMLINRFVEVEDGHYDSIREMKKWLAEKKGP